MKAKVYGERWLHLDLIAESAAEHSYLRRLMAKGHLHLVCKGYGPMDEDSKVLKGESRLLLEPSIVKWQRPKTHKIATTRRAGRETPK